MSEELTPDQALKNLEAIAGAALLNKRDRSIIDLSIKTLGDLIVLVQKAAEPKSG